MRASLLRILSGTRLASFATVAPGGRTHIHTAYFAWSDDWTLVFYSYPTSRHARNLARNSSMAATVFDTHQQWGHPDQGVQLFGRGRELRGAAAATAWRVYSARFPGAERWRASNVREEGDFLLRPFGFRPARVTIFDEPHLGGGRFFDVPIPHGSRSRDAAAKRGR